MSMSGFEFSYYPQEEKHVPEWAKYRSMGFTPVWFADMLGGPTKPDAWECRRGCGSVVWDCEAHIETVCPEWAPRVGDDNG